MKRFVAITSAVVVAFSLAACSDSGKDAASTGDTSQTPAQSETPAPTSTPATTSVDLYLPNDSVDGFVVTAATTDGEPANIVALLVEKKALPAGCALNSFTTTGANSAKVDMNAAFGQAMNSTGTTGEYMMLGSLVNTLLTYFELEEITLTIDGQVLETGHSIFDFPLRFYENF